MEGCEKKSLARGLCDKHYQDKKLREKFPKKHKSNKGEVCSVENCSKEARSKGWCISHYGKHKKYGTPTGIRRYKTGGACSTESCDGKVVAKNLCHNCYARVRRHGSPYKYSDWYNKRYEKIIDDDGYAHVYKPNHSNARKSGRLPEHRLVMSNALGRALHENENVHHKNGVKTDNRIENLELWISSQPSGQRVQDRVKWHMDHLLREYQSACILEVDKEILVATSKTLAELIAKTLEELNYGNS
jgi:hypothetical protein